MHRLTTPLARLAAGLLIAHAALLAVPVQAQNSREAAEAVRKHRAETAGSPGHAANAAAKPDTTRAYRSSADPTANPNASLKSCMDHAGLNIAARDRCFRQHCQGRWGEGQCPPGSDNNVMGAKSKPSHTPLGKCLAEAGNNPFRRSNCGWAHCKPHWATPECKALVPQSSQPSN